VIFVAEIAETGNRIEIKAIDSPKIKNLLSFIEFPKHISIIFTQPHYSALFMHSKQKRILKALPCRQNPP